MIRERYVHMNAAIAPSEMLIEATIRGERLGKRRTTRMRVQRIAIAVALVVAVGAATLPALAEHVPVFYELLYRVYPDIAQFLMPMSASCEDQGIRMEVVSTYVHGDTAEMLVSLQDLTGDRIDETIDLNDSYRIRVPSSMSSTCRLSSFDPETRTAMFLLGITNVDGYSFTGDKVTFSIGNFLSRGKMYEGFPVSLDFANASTERWTQDSPRWPAEDDMNVDYGDAYNQMLLPHEPLDFGVDGVQLTAVGVLDGKLRIQTLVYDGLKNDNHGYFYYVNDAGNKVISSNINYYTQEDKEGNRQTYIECVFDITPEEAAAYDWYADFWTHGMYTEGNWRVTVPLG